MHSRLLHEADSPLVWFVTGAAFASWWRKHPNSRLFWFVAGAGTTIWLMQSPLIDPSRWRARLRARQECIRRRQSEINAEVPVEQEPQTDASIVTLNELMVSMEALRTELAELRSQQDQPVEVEDEHVSTEYIPI